MFEVATNLIKRGNSMRKLRRRFGRFARRAEISFRNLFEESPIPGQSSAVKRLISALQDERLSTKPCGSTLVAVSGSSELNYSFRECFRKVSYRDAEFPKLRSQRVGVNSWSSSLLNQAKKSDCCEFSNFQKDFKFELSAKKDINHRSLKKQILNRGLLGGAQDVGNSSPTANAVCERRA